MSARAEAVVAEEETMLARVLASIATARQARRHIPSSVGLAQELQALREEAVSAHDADLPHFIHQMDIVRAVAERASTGPLPDASAPYFAHLRLDGAAGVRDYFLGRANYTDSVADVRVIDWRTAPLAKIFYNYAEGDDYEETFGDRTVEGTVLMRRLVVIERGVLRRISTVDLQVERGDDEQWREVEASQGSMLGGGSGAAIRTGVLGVGAGKGAARHDVTALLDPSQYEATRVEVNQPMLVLGSAGSGKTTVALHRLARLAEGGWDGAGGQRISQKRFQVVVPEEGLARLNRRILTSMGLDKVPVRTTDAWAVETAKAAFRQPRIAICQDTPALVSRLKRHPALFPALQKRLGQIPKEALSFDGLRRRVCEALTDASFLQGVIQTAKGDLPTTAIEETVRHTLLQLEAPVDEGLQGYDEDALKTMDGRSLSEGTPEEVAGTADLDDLPILMSLAAQAKPLGVEPFAHWVLDEAEDFSVFELFVMGKLLTEERSCTLAGDEMQQTSSDFPGWPAVLQTASVPDAQIVKLKVSYRCPKPITELAWSILGAPPETLPTTHRESVPVGFHHFPEEAPAFLFIRDAIRDLLDREPKASIAVIASDREGANAFYTMVRDMHGVRKVEDGNFSFEPGVDVTHVDEVKGLEWDYVVLPDVTARAYPQTPEARRRLHVAVTRAAHQLWIVSSAVRSRLIPAQS